MATAAPPNLPVNNPIFDNRVPLQNKPSKKFSGHTIRRSFSAPSSLDSLKLPNFVGSVYVSACSYHVDPNKQWPITDFSRYIDELKLGPPSTNGDSLTIDDPGDLGMVLDLDVKKQYAQQNAR